MLARLELARRAGLTQFGEPVLYHAAEGDPPFEVIGVFATPYLSVDLPGAETIVSTTAPILGIDLDDFLVRKAAAGHPATPPIERETFERQGYSWRIVDVQPDTEGRGLTLTLHRI